MKGYDRTAVSDSLGSSVWYLGSSEFWLIQLVWFQTWLNFILTNRLPNRKPDFYYKPAELNQTNRKFWFGSVQDSLPLI